MDRREQRTGKGGETEQRKQGWQRGEELLRAWLMFNAVDVPGDTAVGHLLRDRWNAISVRLRH